MRDTRGRALRDLRVSVTDRCNFRCTYCMPRDVFGPEHAFLDRSELLTFEEIARVVRVMTHLGVQKVRLTGGEPLLRRGLESLIRKLRAVDGVRELALTTNGSLLATRAEGLREAGLDRVTVSLDSLDDTTFRAMSDVRLPVDRVLEGIAAARAAGFSGIKLNAVVRRGLNDDGLLDLARFGREQGHTVRFIEYMDVGSTNGWRRDEVVPADEIVARLDAQWPIDAVAPRYPGEVATRYRYRDGAGEVGVIASVTQPFCGACTRARLSAVGELYTCLFGASRLDVRALLRAGADDESLSARVGATWQGRDDRYSELRSAVSSPRSAPKVEMSYIGG